MAPFDYTTPMNVFNWGSSAGTATDPVNEAAEMARIVTGMSRAIDTYCNQAFSQATYSLAVLPALIDADGILTCYPAVPTMSTPIAADWRLGRQSTWAALTPGDLDIEEHSFGCVLRNLNVSYLGYRDARVQMRLSYTGGWADLAAVPDDFELAMDALCWWAYQKRSTATGDTTAIPDLGVLLVPGSWPPHVKNGFRDYVRQVVM